MDDDKKNLGGENNAIACGGNHKTIKVLKGSDGTTIESIVGAEYNVMKIEKITEKEIMISYFSIYIHIYIYSHIN